MRGVLRVASVALVGALVAGHAHAGAPAPALRVCADPAGLPYSNDHTQGFENRIADILARALGTRVEYTWWAQRRGFLRNSLNAGTCDVVIGAPVGLDMLRTTHPYYRSTFAFVTRRSHRLGDLASIDDPRLATLRIGVPLAGDDGANPAPVHALSRRGITAGLRGFPLYGELGRRMPAAGEALLKDEIDVALLWGPVAGAAVREGHGELTLVPLREENDGPLPFTFAIAVGVRKKDQELAARIDAALTAEHEAIARVLREANIPQLPLEVSDAKR
ncbi:MAG: quinoprotein dehydrogenase-associated probable transporter substrate-binding protein [Labilithrix sp.]|nr:quinoprotein dehydrogenase-associated probable transporter substrate-binding protein [Labilithrix sp.]